MTRRATPLDVDGALLIDALGRRGLIESRFATGNGWVHEVGGSIAGFALVTSSFYGRPFIELVVVRESSRRSGIGRALVSCAIHQHRGSRVFTSTNESNVPMRCLVVGMGFTAAGTIHGLDPEDPELVFYIDGG